MANGIIIAVDGPAGVGKSTTAREVARRLGYTFIDTGAMYRAVALQVLREGVSPDDPQEVVALLGRLHIHLESIPGTADCEVFLNHECVSDEIRGPEVSGIVSQVAAIPAVREHLVAQQQAIGAAGGVVMDGRDIGTVVFPQAELKVFMKADPEARVQRRLEELVAKGKPISEDQVRENLQHRDKVDSGRATSPLRQAEDARVLDTTHLTVDQQVNQVLRWAEERIQALA